MYAQQLSSQSNQVGPNLTPQETEVQRLNAQANRNSRLEGNASFPIRQKSYNVYKKGEIGSKDMFKNDEKEELSFREKLNRGHMIEDIDASVKNFFGVNIFDKISRDFGQGYQIRNIRYCASNFLKKR